ncbi:MAG TPA: NUDIX hydrolase [Acidimicrobiales bacterium]|nr:NUDIX hydrolase [Acidimicrobiales bacterium]
MPKTPTGARRRQRVGAYGICVNADDQVLLTRAAPSLSVAGRWFLPGGGIDHGEDPRQALLREVTEETGLRVEAGALLGVLSDVVDLPDGSGLHTIRIIFAVDRWSGTLRPETNGSTDDARWVPVEAALSMPVLPYVRTALTRLRPGDHGVVAEPAREQTDDRPIR